MKLNRLRNLALGLIFASFLIMFGSLYFMNIFPVMISIGFSVGSILIIVAIILYFRLGAISMRIPQVECPECGRMTKVMSKEDGCMYCSTLFRLQDGQVIKR